MKSLFLKLYIRIISAVAISAAASATLLWMSWQPDANPQLSRFLEPALLQAAAEIRAVDEEAASAQPVVPAAWVERIGVAGLHAPTHARLEAIARLSQETSWPLAALPEPLLDLSPEERVTLKRAGIIYRQARADQLYAAYVRLNNHELLEASLVGSNSSLRDLISGLFFLTSRGAQTAPALSAPLEGIQTLLGPNEGISSRPLLGADLAIIDSARLLYGPRPKPLLTGLSHEVQGLSFDTEGTPHLVTLRLNLWAPLFPPLVWAPLVLMLVWLALWLTLSPLRRKMLLLADVTERFGAGDLSARVGLTEEGPIESLSRRFDRSAERIQALIGAREGLLQAVSHELRTPVARLYFFHEMIVSEQDAEERARVGAEAEETLNELTALTSELLEFSRLNAEPELSREPCDLRELLAAALKQSLPHREGVAVTLEEGARVEAQGDLRLLCRAALNLIKNADIHASALVHVSCGEGRRAPAPLPPTTPSRGVRPLRLPSPLALPLTLPLTLPFRPLSAPARSAGDAARGGVARGDGSEREEERWVWLAVDDDGPGVPVEERARIFEPFVRLELSRDRSSGGAGLGLPIVYGVARAHRGVVWVERSPLGGARFLMSFPVEGAAAGS